MPDNIDDILSFIESNRSAAAWQRDHERELIAGQSPKPVNLAEIPRESWDDFLDYHVTLPESVRAFLAGHDGTPFPTATVHGLEEAVERFHSVSAPYHIACSPQMQWCGRAWSSEPEAAPLLTGFVLGKGDA